MAAKFAVSPEPLPLGEVDLRSKDGEGEDADLVTTVFSRESRSGKHSLVQNAKGAAAVCGSPFCVYGELIRMEKRMACYFTSADWVFLTRLRITAPSTLPTASATQYSTA